MKNHPSAFTVIASIAVLSALVSKFLRQRASAKELRQIHNIVARNLSETEAMHRNLRRTRGAVNQLHQYVMPDPKGVKKAAS
jgi:hypothetical protein